MENLQATINSLELASSRQNLLIFGDFNLSSLKWPLTGSTDLPAPEHQFADIIIGSNFVQHVMQPTSSEMDIDRLFLI